MREVKRFESIADIGRDAWNACFENELENYDYFIAIELASIPGFAHCYYAVIEDGRTLAVVPAFYTEYNLATTADGWLRSILSVLPLVLKLACLGSPETETCTVGFHPSLTDDKKRETFGALLNFFVHDAHAQKFKLTAIKDVSAHHHALLAALLEIEGFCGVTGMPTALLPIDFSSMDEYMARLSTGTRKDMRRKLKKQNELRIEYRNNIDDILDEVHAMYLETRSRSDLQFEELTREFFKAVLTMKNSLCIVYFLGNTPVAANLMLLDDTRLLDKFFCMCADEGHAYNLYFTSWFTNVQYCLDHKIATYQSGQAGYEVKLKLKSVLAKNWIYFRHANPILNGLLRLLSPLLAFDAPGEEV